MFTGVCRCLPVLVGVYRCLQVLIGVCRWAPVAGAW